VEITLAPCHCTRILSSAYLSLVGLGGNIVIHNLHDILIDINQLSIENILFHNGHVQLKTFGHAHDIQLYVDSVQLIESFLSINNAKLGEIVNLQAHNSQVSITSSKNVIFISCTFHGLDEIPWPRTPIGTAVIIDQSHNITFSDNSKFYSNHDSALICYSSVITLAGSVSFFKLRH
jgi:sporulation protein YlmC with PRC-barrel domain